MRDFVREVEEMGMPILLVLTKDARLAYEVYIYIYIYIIYIWGELRRVCPASHIDAC